MSETLFKKTSKGLVWSMTNIVSLLLMKIVVIGVLSRILSPYDFGVSAAALVVFRIIVIFGEVGVSKSLIQKADVDEDHFNIAYSFSFVLGLILSICLFFLRNSIAQFFRIDELVQVIPWLSIAVVLNLFIAVTTARYYKNLKIKQVAVRSVLSYLLGYAIITMTLAYKGFGYWSLVIGVISQTIFEFLFLILLTKERFKWSKNLFKLKELLTFGYYFSLNQILSTFTNEGDNFVIGRFLGVDILGLYSRAYQMYVLPVNLLGQTFNKTLFPAFALIQDNKSKIAKVYTTSFFILFYISLPLSIFLYGSSYEIIHIVLGDKWLVLEPTVQILFLSLSFRIGYKLIDPIINAVGIINKKTYLVFIYATLTIFFAYLGTFYNLNGVALGVSSAVVLHFIFMNILLTRYIRISNLFKLIVLPFFLASIIFLTNYLFPYIIHLNNSFLNFTFKTVIYIIINIVFFLIFKKTIMNNIAWLIERFRNKIK